MRWVAKAWRSTCGRDPARVEAGAHGERLQQLRHPLGGEVPRARVRGEDVARAGRLARLEPRGERRARGIVERRETLLRPLAADEQEATVAVDRRDGEGSELGNPQSRGVEQLDDRDEPARGHRVGRGARRGDQRLDLGDAEDARQPAPAPRRVERGRRVVGAHALLDQEAEELAQAGTPARRAGGAEAARAQPGHVAGERARRRGFERQPAPDQRGFGVLEIGW